MGNELSDDVLKDILTEVDMDIHRAVDFIYTN